MGLVINQDLLAHGPAGAAWPVLLSANLSFTLIIVHRPVLASLSLVENCYCFMCKFDVFQTAAEFLELFRLNLCDIQINPDPYGTHSFRQGGCQYLHLEQWWPIHLICE